MPPTGLPQEVTLTPHTPSSSHIHLACYKKRNNSNNEDCEFPSKLSPRRVQQSIKQKDAKFQSPETHTQHTQECGMGSPDWRVTMFDIYRRRLVWMYCPGHIGAKGSGPADRAAGKAITTRSLRLEEHAVLLSVRTCRRSQSQGRRFTPLIAWRREAWKEEELDTAIVRQTSVETVARLQ